MARSGRKRKEGKRQPNGQLARMPKYDKGTYRAELKQSLYGDNGSDALGRAYERGLLGDNGQALLTTGRIMAAAYWPIFGTGAIRCTLGRQDGNGGDGSLSQEQWLSGQLDAINALGRDYRNAFDSLVIDVHPDEGPSWLDRTIAKQQTKADSEILLRAIYALQKLAA
jgi:hypothetical protein